MRQHEGGSGPILKRGIALMFGAVLIWDVHERNIPSTSGEVLGVVLRA